MSHEDNLGIGLGGMTAMAMALDHPDRVSALAAVACRAALTPKYEAIWPPMIETARTSGIEAIGYGMGVAAGDIDNDGWPDLFVTGDGGRASLLLDEAGYAVTWDGTDEIGRLAATGVYLVRLHAGRVDRTRKLTLIR